MKTIQMQNKWCLVLACMLICLGGCSTQASVTDVTLQNSAEHTDTAAENTAGTGTVDFTSTEVTSGAITVTYTDRELTGAYDSPVTDLELENEDVVISSAGTYVLSGTISDGQIVVEAGEADKVQLVLNGVSITNSDGPAIEIRSADKVFLTLAEGSENMLSDGEAYVLADGEDEPNACVYSKADLCINGDGNLTIYGNYNHGVYSKDDLVITGGTLTVNAVNDGLKGKDCVEICGGTFTIEAGGDGIQSNHAEDAERGYVSIDGGTFVIVAGCDGIQAETCLQVTSGSLLITTGGGSANASVKQDGNWGFWGSQITSAEETESAKGLKAGVALYIADGEISLDSSDDALHANGDITVAGGTIEISSGDDGVHADDALVVTGGSMVINQSYEGMEGNSVTVSGGEIEIIASDDGINAAGGNDGSALNGRPGQGSFDTDTSSYIRITGGTITVRADGDGIDSNGGFYVEGGALFIHGTTSGADGFLDYESEAVITGGTVIAAGGAAMAQAFGTNSTQCSMLQTFDTQVAAGTVLTVCDAAGEALVTFTPENTYQAVLVSLPELTLGETYTITAGEQSVEVTLETVATGSNDVMPGGNGGMRPNAGMGGEMQEDVPQMPEGEFQDGSVPDGTASGVATPSENGIPETDGNPSDTGMSEPENHADR